MPFNSTYEDKQQVRGIYTVKAGLARRKIQVLDKKDFQYRKRIRTGKKKYH